MTVARFRVRHEQALAELVASLKLCAAAGMVRLGLVALDGTKIEANAAAAANRPTLTLRPAASCHGWPNWRPPPGPAANGPGLHSAAAA